MQDMKDCSVVTARYDLGDGVQGTLGVVGPKRMDYEKVVGTLKNLRDQLDAIYKKMNLRSGLRKDPEKQEIERRMYRDRHGKETVTDEILEETEQEAAEDMSQEQTDAQAAENQPDDKDVQTDDRSASWQEKR